MDTELAVAYSCGISFEGGAEEDEGEGKLSLDPFSFNTKDTKDTTKDSKDNIKDSKDTKDNTKGSKDTTKGPKDNTRDPKVLKYYSFDSIFQM